MVKPLFNPGVIKTTSMPAFSCRIKYPAKVSAAYLAELRLVTRPYELFLLVLVNDL